MATWKRKWLLPWIRKHHQEQEGAVMSEVWSNRRLWKKTSKSHKDKTIPSFSGRFPTSEKGKQLVFPKNVWRQLPKWNTSTENYSQSWRSKSVVPRAELSEPCQAKPHLQQEVAPQFKSRVFWLNYRSAFPSFIISFYCKHNPFLISTSTSPLTEHWLFLNTSLNIWLALHGEQVQTFL